MTIHQQIITSGSMSISEMKCQNSVTDNTLLILKNVESGKDWAFIGKFGMQTILESK